MDNHDCKLCFKSFSNGRALGGHMRSHMKKLPLPPKPHESPSSSPTLLTFVAHSPSSSSSSEDDGDNGLTYGLRDNPKKIIRLVDPEFSFVVDTNTNNASAILQDRESETETETESSKKPTRKRSKRPSKLGGFHDDRYFHKKIQQQETGDKLKSNEPWKTESCSAEPEPVSSISHTTTEEDVAYCLLMLSRDKWKRQNVLKDQDDVVEEDGEENDSDESEGAFFKSSKSRIRGKYTCETCKKVFRSYQALGGHRASHKKIKVELGNNNNYNGSTCSSSSMVRKKIHECPFCFRVFSSGQALGGHKRTHLLGPSTSSPLRASTKLVENLIDLNLPAPTYEDEIDNSGVSYAEFVYPIRQ